MLPPPHDWEPTAEQARAQGHAHCMTLSPTLAPRPRNRPHAREPSDALGASPAVPSSAMGAQSSGYKSHGPRLPWHSPHRPAATWWPTTSRRARVRRERRKGEGGGRRSLRRSTFEATRAGDDADIFITVAGRHCTASVYTATTLHCTTILSPTTPTVSARFSPARRRTLLFQPWRSTP